MFDNFSTEQLVRILITFYILFTFKLIILIFTWHAVHGSQSGNDTKDNEVLHVGSCA